MTTTPNQRPSTYASEAQSPKPSRARTDGPPTPPMTASQASPVTDRSFEGGGELKVVGLLLEDDRGLETVARFLGGGA